MEEWLQHYFISGDVAAWFRFLALLSVFLLGFWKALPSVLDAFERRQSGIEVRTEALLDAQSKRFAEQLAQADARHDECMEGQKVLRAEIAELWGIINAMRQGALSTQSIVASAIKEAKQ